MNFKYIRHAFVAGVAVAGIALGSHAHAETLRIGGTGVALGGMRILGDEYQKLHPETTIVVLPSLGSSGGVKALLKGAIGLSVSSRELKEEEKAKGASARLYATTPLAIVTSPETTVDQVTTEQLVDIYSGVTTNWPSGELIRIVLRPQSETDTKLLRALSDEMAVAVDAAMDRPGLVVATTDQENADVLERLPGSLGQVAIGQIATERRNLKVLSHLGTLPHGSLGDAHQGIHKKSLFVVTTEAPSQEATDFVSFVFSPEGQAILEGLDHTPAQ